MTPRAYTYIHNEWVSIIWCQSLKPPSKEGYLKLILNSSRSFFYLASSRDKDVNCKVAATVARLYKE